MEAAFQLLATPRVTELADFRFAYHRVRGPYAPWTRIATHDAVAELLERHEVDRLGAPFGIYYDLPYPTDDFERWTCDLGHPVPEDVVLPRSPGLRSRRLPRLPVVHLRYRGDLASFEPALELLMEWSMERSLEPHGPLLERFLLSDALAGVEERDLYVALEPVPR